MFIDSKNFEKTPADTPLSKGLDHWLGFCLDQTGAYFSPVKSLVYLTAPLSMPAVLDTLRSEAESLPFYVQNHPIFLQALLGRSGIPWRSPQRLKDWLTTLDPQQLATALSQKALRDIGEPFLRYQGDDASTHFMSFVQDLLNYEKYHQVQALLNSPAFSEMPLFPALHKRLSSSGVDLKPDQHEPMTSALYEKHYEKADMILDLLSRTPWQTGLEVGEKPDLHQHLKTEATLVQCPVSLTDPANSPHFETVDWLLIDLEKSELECWLSFHTHLEPLLGIGGQLFVCSNSPKLLESFFGRLIRNYPYLVAGDYQGHYLKVALKTAAYQAPEKSRPFL